MLSTDKSEDGEGGQLPGQLQSPWKLIRRILKRDDDTRKYKAIQFGSKDYAPSQFYRNCLKSYAKPHGYTEDPTEFLRMLEKGQPYAILQPFDFCEALFRKENPETFQQRLDEWLKEYTPDFQNRSSTGSIFRVNNPSAVEVQRRNRDLYTSVNMQEALPRITAICPETIFLYLMPSEMVLEVLYAIRKGISIGEEAPFQIEGDDRINSRYDHSNRQTGLAGARISPQEIGLSEINIPPYELSRIVNTPPLEVGGRLVEIISA